MEYCEILEACKEEVANATSLEQILDISLYFLEAYAMSRIAEEEGRDFLALMRGEDEEYYKYNGKPNWEGFPV